MFFNRLPVVRGGQTELPGSYLRSNQAGGRDRSAPALRETVHFRTCEDYSEIHIQSRELTKA